MPWPRVDLSAYAGQTVTLALRVQTDGSLNSNLFVDDVSFAPSAGAPTRPLAPRFIDAEVKSQSANE